jgi:hypothetical protein
MSPHHFAKMNKNSKISETERESEEKVEEALRHAVAIIATPISAITGKNRRIKRDKP